MFNYLSATLVGAPHVGLVVAHTYEADLLDWRIIEDKLRRLKPLARSDRRGNSGYVPLKMFEVILLDQ